MSLGGSKLTNAREAAVTVIIAPTSHVLPIIREAQNHDRAIAEETGKLAKVIGQHQAGLMSALSAEIRGACL